MSSVIISGDTSGAITVSAPAVSGTNTLTLQAATATSAVNKLETAVASTSGASIDFTALPSWIKKITVMFQGVSTSGSSPPQIQIGSGSFSTSGYLGSNSIINAAPGSALFTSGFGIGVNTSNWSAAVISHGSFTVTLLTGNTWVCFGGVGRSDVAGNYLTNGSIALGGTLDRIRITTVNGTDTFDAGSVNLLLEG
jgi:hypothetical protein